MKPLRRASRAGRRERDPDELDQGPHFVSGVESEPLAWEEIDVGRFMPRRGSIPGIHGGQLIAFGDGYVEIEEVKLAGGVTVGVATDEPECRVPDSWKRQRLIGVGADYIIPNFLCRPALLPMLFANHEPI